MPAVDPSTSRAGGRSGGVLADPAGGSEACYAPAVDVDVNGWWPVISQLGVGGIAGFAVGYALKKVGKLLAVAVGLLFVVVQLLAYQGFLTVNWGEVEARVDPLLQTDSLGSAWESLLAILTHNLVFAGAFVPGLLVGLRRG